MPAVVPYVTARSTDRGPYEAELTVEFTTAGPRIAYRSPLPGDRDKHGNLWARIYTGPGNPEVEFDSMHTGRQRECMENMLCQVCAKPADRTKEGWLFIDWRRPESPPTWPERSVISQPPLCMSCARLAVRICPFLRGHDYAVLRARKAALWGVSGTLYVLTNYGWAADEKDTLRSYGDQQCRGMLASRLWRQLRGVKVVDL